MVQNRLVAVAVLAASVIFLPWWAAAALIVGGVLWQVDFFEAIILAFWLDLLYGPGAADLWRHFIFTIGFTLFILIVEFSRSIFVVRR